ncbi:MAG TPA: hypothetical protein VIZ65_00860 [Cellvibrionaceae bacterium]
MAKLLAELRPADFGTAGGCEGGDAGWGVVGFLIIAVDCWMDVV